MKGRDLEAALGTGRGLLAAGDCLRFAHGVNSRERLARVLAEGHCNALEADVSWGFRSGAPGVRLPVMAHPPIDESDLSFEEWLDAVVEVAGVFKIDIKDRSSNIAVVEILSSRKLPPDRYILNSDVVAGAGGPPPLTVAEAIEWRRRFGEVVISIGCTTGDLLVPYLDDEVAQVLEAAEAIGRPVTVCLEVHRIEAAPRSLERVREAGHHVTVWNQFPADTKLFRRYRALLPDAFIDLFDEAREPIVE